MARTLVDLADWLDTLPQALELQSSELKEAADRQVQRIKQRTAEGISVELAVFPNYAKRSHKTAPVTLRDTGAMLDGIRVHATTNEALIDFEPAQQAKAKAHNDGTDRLPARHFFGVSLTDRTQIINDLKASVLKRIRG